MERSAIFQEDFMFAEILTKLPVKSLGRFKCVSKTWLNRISGDLSFIAAHLDQQRDRHAVVNIHYMDGTPPRTLMLSDHFSKTSKEVDAAVDKNCGVQIAGCCNGLVCLMTEHPGVHYPQILLWNPATRQVRKLPDAPQESVVSYGATVGIGFDAASGEYKIVNLAVKGPEMTPILCAQVFAKSGTAWRGGEEEERGVPGITGTSEFPDRISAVEAGGALHWAAYRESWPGSFVLSFSLSDEALKMVDAPGEGSVFLYRWGASLAAVTYADADGETGVMWAATSAGGGNLCWGKLFNINLWASDFIGFWRGELLSTVFVNDKTVLQLHDGSGRARQIELPGNCWQLCDAHEYVHSIISLF